MKFKILWSGTVLALALLMPGVASAGPRAPGLAADNPGSKGYVVVYPEDGVEVRGATFYPTGEISDDTMVVLAEEDGSLPGGVTEDALASLIETARSIAATTADGLYRFEADTTSQPVGPLAAGHNYSASFAWTGPWLGTNLIGMPNAKVTYSFNVTEGSNQMGLGQGRGFRRGYLGSDFGVWAEWYSIGTATSNSPASYQVPWGEVMAATQFKARSLILVHLATGRWWP